MVHYRRNLIAGGTFFLTPALANRASSILTDHVALLRTAFRLTRREHPFTIEAIVILPDHMHIVMTLPAGDADFPIRMSLSKRRFTASRFVRVGFAFAQPTLRIFPLPGDHRIGLPDRLAFIAKSLQGLVGDFCPNLLQLRCRRLVRVPLRVIWSPRHSEPL
jgi:REP element-mobilizing transposase RayT